MLLVIPTQKSSEKNYLKRSIVVVMFG